MPSFDNTSFTQIKNVLPCVLFKVFRTSSSRTSASSFEYVAFWVAFLDLSSTLPVAKCVSIACLSAASIKLASDLFETAIQNEKREIISILIEQMVNDYQSQK